jgi:hypothetical protein
MAQARGERAMAQGLLTDGRNENPIFVALGTEENSAMQRGTLGGSDSLHRRGEFTQSPIKK